MEPSEKEHIKLQEENLRLKSAVEELSILNDIATAITSTQSLEKIIELIVNRCIKHLRVEQGAVMLLEEQDTEKPFQTMIRKQEVSANILPYRFDAQLTGWMLKYKAPLLVNDIKSDDRFKYIDDIDLPFNTLLSVPISLKGSMIGLLTVVNKKSEAGFSTDDQRLLSIIAAQSAHVLENARLLKQEQALLQMEEEIRLAKEIQLNILPKEIPSVEDYDIYAINIPAKEVGGDYFDFIKLPDGKIAFCLGDITGKGLSAAMLMANLQATLRGQAFIQKSISEIVKNSNLLLFNSTDSNRFATLFFGTLDFSKHIVTYCNAGHDSPIHISGENVFTLTAGGTLLGCFESAEYEEAIKGIEPNELIVIYTDGVTEAMNEKNEVFSEEKLLEVINANRKASAKELTDIIINEVKNHSANTPQFDDITLMIIKRVG
ncbi:MAG: SpoIIE family protein phosphatase [Ignavibacteriaceae bacterium]|nr:SpoIIE family protein phosphatase [Ignavibacteria bacterium]NNL20703.1 SpoIIE family protein phosphatase [Ignavibacteriaceae bacterium]